MSFLQLLVSLQEKEKITKDEEDINQGRDKIPTNHTFHVSWYIIQILLTTDWSQASTFWD